jgi:hypothetical protein
LGSCFATSSRQLSTALKVVSAEKKGGGGFKKNKIF